MLDTEDGGDAPKINNSVLLLADESVSCCLFMYIGHNVYKQITSNSYFKLTVQMYMDKDVFFCYFIFPVFCLQTSHYVHSLRKFQGALKPELYLRNCPEE